MISFEEELELAWMAGFVDGDGSIYFAKPDYPMIAVYNKQASLLYPFKERFGGSVYFYPYTIPFWCQRGKRLGSSLVRCLLELYPHLRHPGKLLKLEKALKVIGFHPIRLKDTGDRIKIFDMGKLELHWMAGFIDSDGGFCITSRKDNKGSIVYRIAVAHARNIERILLEPFFKRFGGFINVSGRKRELQGNFPLSRDCYLWRLKDAKCFGRLEEYILTIISSLKNPQKIKDAVECLKFMGTGSERYVDLIPKIPEIKVLEIEQDTQKYFEESFI